MYFQIEEIVSVISADPSTPLPATDHDLTYAGVMLRYIDFWNKIQDNQRHEPVEVCDGGICSVDASQRIFSTLLSQEEIKRIEELIRLTEEEAQKLNEMWTGMEATYINNM